MRNTDDLRVELEPGLLELSEQSEERLKREILGLYAREYEKLTEEYHKYIVPGKGHKTNKFGQPGFNEAYDYIQHPKYHGIAQERGRSFEYWRSVWSVACDRVCAILNNGIPDEVLPWRLRLDHGGIKTNDFLGTLILYKSPDWWWVRNGHIDKRP